jgi:hypothetical protein
LNTKIILITGKKQSGKDTSTHFLIERFKEMGKTAKRYAFADSLKQLCMDYFGLKHSQLFGDDEQKNSLTQFTWESLPIDKQDISKIMHDTGRYPKLTDPMTAREFMQVVGTNIFRHIYPDIWAKFSLKEILLEEMNYAILSDVRFPNEIEIFKEYNPTVIRLLRNKVNSEHRSETALDDYDFSKISNYFEIDNSHMSIPEKNAELERILPNLL